MWFLLLKFEDGLPAGIFLFQVDGPPVEGEAHQERFAPVPVEGDLRNVVRGDVFPDDRLQHPFAHPGLPPAVDLRLVQIVAVGAAEVAQRPGAFEHDVESCRTCDPDGVLQQELVMERMRHLCKGSKKGGLSAKSEF